MLCCFNITCIWSIMSDNFYIYSDFSMRCIRRTTRGWRSYRSSHVGCRFGRSGSSGFVVGFRRLHWSSRVPVPRVRSCRDWCRYRYICRPSGLLAANGCRSRQMRFPLWGYLKLLCLSDDLKEVLRPSEMVRVQTVC